MAGQPKATPLKIWAVSDGRAGIENQVVGLAEAVARQHTATIEIKRVGWTEIRQNAVDDDEAYEMRTALGFLANALREAGYAPR